MWGLWESSFPTNCLLSHEWDESYDLNKNPVCSFKASTASAPLPHHPSLMCHRVVAAASKQLRGSASCCIWNTGDRNRSLDFNTKHINSHAANGYSEKQEIKKNTWCFLSAGTSALRALLKNVCNFATCVISHQIAASRSRKTSVKVGSV